MRLTPKFDTSDDPLKSLNIHSAAVDQSDFTRRGGPPANEYGVFL